MISMLILLVIPLLRKGLGFGVDWGSEFHKAALVMPGKGFKMVEDQMSKRKSHNILTFCGDKRLFEYRAMIKFQNKRCNAFYFLNRWLDPVPGMDMMSKVRVYPEKYFLEEKQTDFDGQRFFFQPSVLAEHKRNDTDSFYLNWEELIAMGLRNNIDNAERMEDIEVREGFVTIPSSSMSIEARLRLRSAYKLARFDVLGFVTENMAAAIYDQLNNNYVEADDIGNNILYINLGSLNSKLSVLKNYAANETLATNETVYHPAVRNLYDMHSQEFNGQMLDICLMELVLEKTISQGTTQESRFEPTKLKFTDISLFKKRQLLNSLKKSKEILSANKKVYVNVEDFFGDKALRTSVHRDEFVSYCEPVFNQLEGIIDNFKSNFNDKIDKVELLGGIVRIPRVQEILNQKLNITLGQHINGDDGMAMGAALIGANYSAGVRTKKIKMSEKVGYDVEIEVRFDNKTGLYKQSVLFGKETSKLGHQKSVTISNLNDNIFVTLRAFPGRYWIEYHINNVNSTLARFENKTVVDKKVLLKLELDLLGLPRLKRAEMMVKEVVEERYNKTINNTNTTSNDTNSTTNDTTTTNETNSTNASNSSNSSNTVEAVRNKTLKHKESLLFTVRKNFQGLEDNETRWEDSKAVLKKLEEFEEEKRKLSKTRNQLEGFIYKLKEIVNDAFKSKFLSEDDKAEFLKRSEELDQWFESDEAYSKNLTIFSGRVKELETIVGPFRYRIEEFNNRESLLGKARQFFKNFTDNMGNIRKYKAWIPEEKVLELRERLNATKETIEAKVEEQKDLKMYENPVFNSGFVYEKVEDLNSALKRVMLMKKPKKKQNITSDFQDHLKDMDMKDLNMTKEQVEEMLAKLKRDMKDNPNYKIEDPFPTNEEPNEQKQEDDGEQEQQEENGEQDQKEGENENQSDNQEGEKPETDAEDL